MIQRSYEMFFKDGPPEQAWAELAPAAEQER